MSRLAVNDIDTTTVLEPTAMADITGGAVYINEMTANIRSADDQALLSPDALSILVNSVVDGLGLRR